MAIIVSIVTLLVGTHHAIALQCHLEHQATIELVATCTLHIHISVLCLLCGDGCVSALPSSHSQCFAESQEAPGSLGLVATGELSLCKEHHGSGSVVH